MDLLTDDALLRTMFGAAGHVWSVGTLSAFMALPEGVPTGDDDTLILASGDSLVRLRPGGKLLAFETLSSDPRGWNHGIAVCLPVSAERPSGRLRMQRDTAAILPADRERVIVDLGLGQGPARALFRPEGAPLPDGMPWSEAAVLLEAMPGTWILDTPILRIETRVTKGIGFHHVEQALETGRAYAETTPVPPGLMPVAHVFPPHPARARPGVPTTFDPDLHARFQAILMRHGRPDLRALKTDIQAQLAANRFDPPRTDRHGTTVVRVALRQHLMIHGDAPRDWLSRFDRPLLRLLDSGTPG